MEDAVQGPLSGSGAPPKPKERTWENCGPRKILTVAGRMMASSAGMEWHRRNVVKTNRTEEKVE
jgi:hypothetical protein